MEIAKVLRVKITQILYISKGSDFIGHELIFNRTANAITDLSLRTAYMHIVGFVALAAYMM